MEAREALSQGFGAVGQGLERSQRQETDHEAWLHHSSPDSKSPLQCNARMRLAFAFPLHVLVILQCSVVDCMTWNKLRKAAKVLERPGPRGRLKPEELELPLWG